MADMAVLKVKIGLTSEGYAQYPNFNTLAVVMASGMDWSKYIDKHGLGWMYDYIGHDDVASDSPRGQQWGMIVAPEAFVTQAVSAFPTTCSRLTDAEAQAFHDSRVTVDQPDEEIDEVELQKIKLKQDMGIALTKQQKRALDPRDTTPGVRLNRRKKFATLKADKDVNIVDP